MTAVLTAPIKGSETFDSMIGTAMARTERWLTETEAGTDMGVELLCLARQVKFVA